MSRLLDTALDLERAHLERQEQQTIWPLVETPAEAGDAIIGGTMSELLDFAKRIATTNVGVLITGESGTGKEVFAERFTNSQHALENHSFHSIARLFLVKC